MIDPAKKKRRLGKKRKKKKNVVFTQIWERKRGVPREKKADAEAQKKIPMIYLPVSGGHGKHDVKWGTIRGKEGGERGKDGQ